MIHSPIDYVVPDETMGQLLLSIAQLLVDDDAAVQVKCSESNRTMVLNLRVAACDIGKVVGKRGRTARSLRTILGAVGMKLDRRYALNIKGDAETLS